VNQVEVLVVEGCPNREAALKLVEQVAVEEAVALDMSLVEVTSPEDAAARRFLGSPSIRVNGHDVEPGADDRQTFMLACRVYRTDRGLSNLPARAWVRAALAA
jgi:hypothetical protein